MTDPLLIKTWHHLTDALYFIIIADETPTSSADERRKHATEAQEHAKQADVTLRQFLANRQDDKP